MNIVNKELVNNLNNDMNNINNIFSKIMGRLNRQNIIQTLLINNIWNIVIINDLNNIEGIIINSNKKLYLNIYDPNINYSKFENVKFLSLKKNINYINNKQIL